MSSIPPKAVLYLGSGSVWCAAVLLALEEKGYADSEVDKRIVNLEQGENFAPSFLRLNPHATVPTLVVPLQKTLSDNVETRFKSITYSHKIVEFLDKSRSSLSKTHTVSTSPAPSLAAATIAFATQTTVIVDIVHDSAADPNMLKILNAHDEVSLQAIAKETLPFLQGRHDALTRYISEADGSTTHLSEKTKKFYREKQASNEAMLRVMLDASNTELTAAEKSQRDAYFVSATTAWQNSLCEILVKLNKEIIAPYALGEQFSVADLSLAAWLARVLSLCGVSALNTSGAITKLEERSGAMLPKDYQAMDRKETTKQSKLAAFWAAASQRPSLQKVYAAGLY